MTKTIREAHNWASSFLQQHSSHSADECHFTAEVLLRHLLSWNRARFFAYLDDPFPSELWTEWRRLVKQKSAGVPLQYLIGSQEFYGRHFRVDPHVLIPRPETEGLVEEVLRRAASIWEQHACTVVDVGTGSGAIAVTLAAERPAWHVTACDLSRDALRTARDNAAQHKVEQRIRFLQGDLVTPLIERGERVDIVVSNPPYIPTADIETLATEVREHEPRLALDGGTDGLDVYRKLATMLPLVTKQQKGLVALEVGKGQSARVARLLRHHLPGKEMHIVEDLAGIERIVTMYWS